MTPALHLYREQPGSIPPAVLRPFLGGPDLPFNTRWRDVQIGVTKPTAATTGILPGTVLTPVHGDQIVTTPGLTFEGLEIFGAFYNRAPGTVLRNCRIRAQADPGVGSAVVQNVRPDNPLVLEDCEILSDVVTYNLAGVQGGNYTATRCKMHDVVDFFDVQAVDGDTAGPTNVTIQGCYGYDFLYVSPDPTHVGGGTGGNDNATHNDGVQVMGGFGTVVHGCRFDMTESPNSLVGPGGHPSEGLYGQGLTVTPVDGAVGSFLFEENWLDYGKIGVTGSGFPNGLSGIVRNNRFGRNITPSLDADGLTVPRAVQFVVGDDVEDFPTSTGPDLAAGNVYDDDGTPVTIYRRAA